ncbi:MAG: ABC transporter substrate-binding protein [Anaerolineales bacterium]
MLHKRFTLFIFSILMAAGLLLSGCAQATPQPTPEAPQTTQPAQSEPVAIRMAILPILDNLPMYVAQQEGLFEANNVSVEFIPVGSAAERDQVIVAGRADGMINETISTLLYNKDQPQVQIVGFSRTATPTTAQYSILSAGDSGIESAQDLKGVEIGISEGTIIEYITDRLLEAEGFSTDEIQTVAVPKISDRMALLGSGELKAATLPDPLSLLAIQQGAQVVLDDTSHPEYGYSTYSFVIPFIESNPQAVRGFLAAVAQATEMINADPTQWDTVLTEQNLVPAPLIGSYKVPPFPTPSVPSQEQWQDALEWAKAKGLVGNDVPYNVSVSADYLP